MSFTLFYILVITLCEAKGIVLNPVLTKSHTYCLGKDEPIILTNPFPDILNGGDISHLVGMEWYRNVSGYETKLTSALEPFNSPVPNVVSYEKWGLQINSVSPKDSGNYFAFMSSTTYATLRTDVNIYVASYPVLKSESLSVKEITNGDGSKTYSCGEIASLGQPPINIIMKASNGTILPSTFSGGYQLITLPKGIGDIGLVCEIDINSPAYRCIPETDLSRWEFSSTGESQTASSNFLIYIIAGSVGLVGLVSIVILVVVICKRRKRGKKYNAKEKEAEAQDNYDHPDSPLVKHKGPSSGSDNRTANNSGSSYPTSRHSYPQHQPEEQEDYEEYELNGKGRLAQRSSPPPPVAPKYRKKSEPVIDSRGNEVRPPEKKPRSIFLTPSMEELDKINEAVRGGKGSEPAGTMV